MLVLEVPTPTPARQAGPVLPRPAGASWHLDSSKAPPRWEPRWRTVRGNWARPTAGDALNSPSGAHGRIMPILRYPASCAPWFTSIHGWYPNGSRPPHSPTFFKNLTSCNLLVEETPGSPPPWSAMLLKQSWSQQRLEIEDWFATH